MALKIEPNQSTTAFHITDGAVRFPYAVDAQHAISNHPMEWSDTPWTKQDADAGRARMKEQYDRDVADAKARGAPVPAPLPPLPPEPTPEEQAAIHEHARAVAEANERLKVAREKAAKKKAEEDQIAADEALVVSLPPQPDPNVRRPLSPAQIRKASSQLTPAEQKVIDDRAEADRLAAARKAADEKMARDKAEADRLAASNATKTF